MQVMNAQVLKRVVNHRLASLVQRKTRFGRFIYILQWVKVKMPDTCVSRFTSMAGPLGLLGKIVPTPFIVNVLFLLVCFSLQPANAGVVATSIAIEVDGQRTRFVAEVSGVLAFDVRVSGNPDQIIIASKGLRFNLPKGAGRKVKGLASKMRYGVDEKGTSQFVIDTQGFAKIVSSQLVPKKGKRKARIVVEFELATPVSAVGPDDVVVTGSLTAAPPRPTLLPGLAARLAGKKVIVIDAGHGGMDPGAVSPRKVKEKDVVLAFAQELSRSLLATGRYEVVLTRDDDRFVTLAERVKVARSNQADLFVAIHADTVRGPSARGTTIYTLSETGSDEEAEALAQKENKADVIGGIDLGQQNSAVADILIDLALRESKGSAVLFSRVALSHLTGKTTLTGVPLRSAGFVVLKAPDVPSVLIELGYLSSKEDEKNMISPAWRATLAEALANAVDDHFAGRFAASTP